MGQVPSQNAGAPPHHAPTYTRTWERRPSRQRGAVLRALRQLKVRSRGFGRGANPIAFEGLCFRRARTPRGSGASLALLPVLIELQKRRHPIRCAIGTDGIVAALSRQKAPGGGHVKISVKSHAGWTPLGVGSTASIRMVPPSTISGEGMLLVNKLPVPSPCGMGFFSSAMASAAH